MMGGGKLLWVVLMGLGLLVLIAAKSPLNQKAEAEVVAEEKEAAAPPAADLVEEGEEEFEEDDDECDEDCQRDCDKIKCRFGVARDSCGCCQCKRSEGGMAPEIVSKPSHIKNNTGGSAALSCEVIGDPIPFISWLKTNVNNETAELPGDDEAIMTLTQGGPERHEITAWLQIMKLRKNHEGDYSCVAFNKHGTAKRTARLKVQKTKKRKHHHHKKE